MHSTLCEAVARCHLRRLRGVAAAAPLPAAIVALVVVTAPVILFRLGGAVGDEVADSIGTAGVSDALVLGPLLAAAVAGAALAVAAPPRSALGVSGRRRPIGRGDRRCGAHARSRGCRLDRRRALSGRPLRRARARPSRRSCRRRCARCGDARRRSRRRRRRRRRARRRAQAAPPRARRGCRSAWAGSWWASLSEPRPLGPLALVPRGPPWRGLPVARTRRVEWRRDRALCGLGRSRRNARRATVPSSAEWGAPVDGACRLRLPRSCCSHGGPI